MLPQTYQLFCFPIFWTLNVPDEGYCRTSNVPDEGYCRTSNVSDEGYCRTSNVPDKGYCRNEQCVLNYISTFLFQSCILIICYISQSCLSFYDAGYNVYV